MVAIDVIIAQFSLVDNKRLGNGALLFYSRGVPLLYSSVPLCAMDAECFIIM